MTEKPVYRMSQSGSCPRKLGSIRLGLEAEPAPKWLATSAEEGNWHEKRIKEELFEEGYFVHSEQEELILEYDKFILTGHIDGMVTKDGLWSTCDSKEPVPPSKLLEIKSMSQFEFDRWIKNDRFIAFPQYASQLACYFAGTGLDGCLYIVKNRNNGYTDTQVVSSKNFPTGPIIEKITKVEQLASQGKLSEVEFDPNSIECRRCQFKRNCLPKITDLDIATRQELDMAVAKIREGNQLIAEGKKLYDEGKSILYKHTLAKNLKKWQHDDLSILLVNVKAQTTYPKEDLLAKYGEDALADIARAKDAYNYLKLNDLLGEE